MEKKVIGKVTKEISDQMTLLCGADSYRHKVIFNPEFEGLPKEVQDELKDICLDFAQDIGGIIAMAFTPEGVLGIFVSTKEGDMTFDNIGCDLKIKEIQREKEELMESLESYFRVFFLGEDLGEECESEA